MSKSKQIQGKVYVLGDNIDTDVIIPAQYLNLVPTIPEEYRKLGSYALAGMPDAAAPFVKPGQDVSEYRIIVARRNFGCGSSREHAPIALGAAGCEVVVAASYARIFFRNAIATGELFPCESEADIADEFKTGDEAAVDIEAQSIRNMRTGKTFSLKPLGDVAPVIEAGGIFAYAREVGMIKQKSA